MKCNVWQMSAGGAYTCEQMRRQRHWETYQSDIKCLRSAFAGLRPRWLSLPFSLDEGGPFSFSSVAFSRSLVSLHSAFSLVLSAITLPD